MGDWRSVSGQFFPRDLAVIDQYQVADCKDFSAATAAILNSLGFKADVVLVRRGTANRSFADVPIVGAFNHAMVKVINQDNLVYWIDPTNDVSMAQGTFPDIAGKMVLTLNLDQPQFEQIPEVSAERAQMIRKEIITLQPKQNNNMFIKGKIALLGEEALYFTGKELYESPEQIKNELFYALSGSYVSDAKKIMQMPDLSSRIVSDLNIAYSYADNKLLKTNYGYGIKMNSPYIDHIIDTDLEQFSDQIIGPPKTRIVETVIKAPKKATAKNLKELNYKIDTPWLYFERKCNNQNKQTQIIHKMVIKTKYISNQDLKSARYKELKQQLQHNVKNAVVIFGEK
jgi:hypothetical protein